MAKPLSTRAYLSLGSNLGDRARNIATAISSLREIGEVAAMSSLYETEPVEFTDQPWFLNSAVALDTKASPAELMADILAIEEKMGRRRLVKKGPRVIDIDILFFGDQVVESSSLLIPHPSIAERRFVLEPLAEIAPDAVHPVSGKTVRQLRDALPAGQQVRRVAIEQ
ncbi:MAG TPA: 2-amino-4-hydroxy-6-hydroxymethyldihydropteridine diphosphokinase [Candidatus Binatia bacterium]|nr:2-amino-4-hydroxy-6-hydroxymethyldihydropteridine diphosphokinase [Candidatus Binatia bacterium]